jgi:hypothetical protein
MWNDLQTIQQTYQMILQGERPWTALGDFLNYWYAYAAHRREDLIKEPIAISDDATTEKRQWAAFCAATVESLCLQHQVSLPEWVNDPLYTLPAPWFTGLGASKPHIQAQLLVESPEPFRKRNIYCRAHVLSTKYDVAAKVQPATA